MAFALFAAVQLADAVLTQRGVDRYGPSIEANPIIGASMQVLGVPAALTIWKLVACAGGALLHICEQYLALALLTVVFVVAATLPWAFLLAF